MFCMAMYKEHSLFNLTIALPIFLGGAYYFLKPAPPLLITFGTAFAYSTLFMSPDVDLANQIRLFSLRGLLTLPFRSYAKLFCHRGLSHNILFGSLTRILWLSLWAFLAFAIYHKALPTQKLLLKLYHLHKPFILYSLAAICLADWCHLLLDRKELKKSPR